MNRLVLLLFISSVAFSLPPRSPIAAQDSSLNHHPDNIDDVIAYISTTNFRPKREGIPGRTAGGGSRNGTYGCPSSSHNAGVSLVPLVVAEAQSLTTAEYPSFLVHITNRSVNQLLLSVKGHQGYYDYQTLVPISDDSGVLTIVLPSDAPPLEVGASYQWGVAIFCGETLQPDDPFIQGYIRRIQGPDLTQRSVFEQLAWYAGNNVWYDTISLLAEMRIRYPDALPLQESWVRMLTSVELEGIADAAILLGWERYHNLEDH